MRSASAGLVPATMRRREEQLAGLPELGEPLGGAVVLGAVVGVRQAHEAPEPRLHVGSLDVHVGPQAEHLHRPPPVGGNAPPGVRCGRSRHRGVARGDELAQVGRALEQTTDTVIPAGRRGRRRASSIARIATMPRRRRERRRREHGADDLRIRDGRGGRARGRALRADPRRVSPRMRWRERSSPWVSIWSRYRNAMRGTARPSRASSIRRGRSSRCSSSSWRPELRDDRAEEDRAVRSAGHREVDVAEGDAPRRHVPARVANVQLGQQHPLLLPPVGQRRSTIALANSVVLTSVAPSIRRAKS